MSKIEELIQDIKDKVIPSEIIKKLDQLKPYVELAEMIIEHEALYTKQTSINWFDFTDEVRALKSKEQTLIKQIKAQNES